MMMYPEHYASLTEEEMEYTTGGAFNLSSTTVTNLLMTVCATATSLLAYVNVVNVGSVAAQLKKEYPDAYPEEEGTLNGNLIIDSAKVYFTSIGGAVFGIANIATAAGYLYLLLR